MIAHRRLTNERDSAVAVVVDTRAQGRHPSETVRVLVAGAESDDAGFYTRLEALALRDALNEALPD